MDSEAIRKLVDERAEHKARNVMNAELPAAIRQGLLRIETDVSRNQQRIDDLAEADRDRGERLVRVESQVETVAATGVEIMSMLGRMDGKLDDLTKRVYSGGKA